MSDELAPFLEDERRRDVTRLSHWRDEAARHRGVCWSGLAGEAPAPRSEPLLQQAARSRLRDLQAWRARPGASLLSALSRAQQAAQATFLSCESARAALARNAEPATDFWLSTAQAWEGEAEAILAAARAARQGLAAQWPAEQDPPKAC